MNRRPLCVLIVFTTVLLLASGCVETPRLQSGNDTIRILVTQHMGTQVHLDETVAWQEGTTVLEALHEVADVQTAHDGAFVVAINGLESGYPEEHTDWFYHVDGRLAGSGAGDHVTEKGDVIVWDHRPWDHTMTLPYLLNGIDPPGPQETLPPHGLAEHTDHPHVFLRLDGDHLIILDARAQPQRTVPPPWLAAHVIQGDDREPVLLTAASGERAHDLLDRLETWTPQGLGHVVTPDETHPIPAHSG